MHTQTLAGYEDRLAPLSLPEEGWEGWYPHPGEGRAPSGADAIGAVAQKREGSPMIVVKNPHYFPGSGYLCKEL